ncbi:MFS transporter [Bacillus sp. BRMEA1]|uniref:MFS transporter n=1 Tax=Neobacillus endophyticus TaxID=2738405 RepID=UPI00156543D8|nr:MFS transporter [Neobacillus endophyticus]NRD79201.1 MFS transporter [Neobacillus endophyticus]
MNWKRTLLILWFADFFGAMGMSLILPFLPLYIEQLGVHETASIERWTGWIFAAQFIVSVFFQPLWGSMADKYGRKVMLLRAGFGMGVVTALMGLVTQPWQLLVLRIINGVFSGFMSMSVSLQASVTPNEQSGKALGTLQTGLVAGSLLGPLAGGILAEKIGYHHIFYLTGALLCIAGLLILFFVHEDHKPGSAKEKKKVQWYMVKPLLPVFIASFVTNLGMMSIEPLATVYAKTLYHGMHLEFFAGLVVSITGMANLIGAPTLGRIGDKIGQKRVLAFALMMAALAFIPQALAGNITTLLIGRFLLGLFIGGMVPSLNVLVKKLAPPDIQATVFGLNSSSLFLGNFVGPLIGSHVAAAFGIRSVFYVTMAILMINSISIYFNQSMETKISPKQKMAS